MGQFRYIPPDEMAKRHRAKERPMAPSRQHPTKTPQLKNIEQVLSLGDTRYITFRNQLFRVPPIPFRVGQRVLGLHVEIQSNAMHVAKTGDPSALKIYYRSCAKMARLLWQHIRPAGKLMRTLWRLRLLRNPFMRATDEELKEITDFFLQGRTMSSVRSSKDPQIRIPS